jgi:hypothetical protein
LLWWRTGGAFVSQPFMTWKGMTQYRLGSLPKVLLFRKAEQVNQSRNKRDSCYALLALDLSVCVGLQRPEWGHGGSAIPAMKETIILAACGAEEILPQNADLPADVFTACLTTPIKIALTWCVNAIPVLFSSTFLACVSFPVSAGKRSVSLVLCIISIFSLVSNRSGSTGVWRPVCLVMTGRFDCVRFVGLCSVSRFDAAD